MAKKIDGTEEATVTGNTEEVKTETVEEVKVIIPVSTMVRVVSRVDYPVTISYGNEMKRLPPRFNDFLDQSKLPNELPSTLQIV